MVPRERTGSKAILAWIYIVSPLLLFAVQYVVLSMLPLPPGFPRSHVLRAALAESLTVAAACLLPPTLIRFVVKKAPTRSDLENFLYTLGCAFFACPVYYVVALLWVEAGETFFPNWVMLLNIHLILSWGRNPDDAYVALSRSRRAGLTILGSLLIFVFLAMLKNARNIGNHILLLAMVLHAATGAGRDMGVGFYEDESFSAKGSDVAETIPDYAVTVPPAAFAEQAAPPPSRPSGRAIIPPWEQDQDQ